MIPVVGWWYTCRIHSPPDEGGEWVEPLLRTADGWKSVTGSVICCAVTPMRWTPHPRVTYTELAVMLRDALEIGNAQASGQKNSAEKWREFASRTQRRIAL